ncbi:MAG: response regulator transcription factor [Acidobacteria bacterium]|nr:response regulator transcription factor [Acidobacteriota bacterium]
MQSTTANPIRVFVVDDHQVVRMGLKTMLESECDIVVTGMAASGREALEKLQTIEADVVLTDLRMGEMSGDQLLEELRRQRPDIRAAVLTNYHSDEEVFRAMKAGAMAFVLKTAPMEQVVAAVRAVHNDERAIPSHIAQQLAERLGRNELSARELEILHWVARGWKNREIAEKLFISENTVRNHVISCLEKLGSRDRTEASAVAIRQGLVRLDDD